MTVIHHILKAIYIHIPKAGGSFVEMILKEFYGFEEFDYGELGNSVYFDEEVKDGFFRVVLSKSLDAKEIDLSTYYTFTFVRNPYSRCISAFNYLNRIRETYGSKVLDRKVSLSEYFDLAEQNKLTPFAHYHIMTSQKKHLEDLSGVLRIDYIGRFENLNSELVYIITEILKQKIKFRRILEEGLRRNVNPVSRICYREEFSPETLEIINRVSSEDFEHFDFIKVNRLEDIDQSIPEEGKPENESLISRIEAEYNFGNDMSINVRTNNYGECKV